MEGICVLLTLFVNSMPQLVHYALVEVNQTLTLVACVAAGWLVGLVLLALVCAFVCVPSCLRPVLG